MTLLLLLVLALCSSCYYNCSSFVIANDELSPDPTWLMNFSVEFEVLVKQYGSDWNSTGTLYYNWTRKVTTRHYGCITSTDNALFKIMHGYCIWDLHAFRSDWLGWCLPLYKLGPSNRNSYSCSYLAIDDNMYFVNHTGHSWSDNDCCMFEKGIGPLPPDWMGNAFPNGTEYINNTLCAVWWFPGSSNPDNGCFVYWSAVDAYGTPMRFFGLTALGPTILNYSKYRPFYIPPEIQLELPNSKCNRKCLPSTDHDTRKTATNEDRPFKTATNKNWPFKWPSC